MSRARTRIRTAVPSREIAVTGKLDKHGLEALRLEATRMAKRYGIDVRDIRVEAPRRRAKQKP